MGKAPGGDDNSRNEQMEPSNWAPAHSDALREHLANGLSFSKIAKAINSQFNTSYTRNATIGRANRMGLAVSDRPEPGLPAQPPPPDTFHEGRPVERKSPEPRAPTSWLVKARPVKLRCVGIEPRHLSLIELERGDCRYPYGGDEDGEVITFCGHPRQTGSSYCAPHFNLSRNPDGLSEPAVSAALLRLIEMA
jgi:GcrA cell cycle regulator